MAPDCKELFVQCCYFCLQRIGNNKLPFVKTLIFVKIFFKVFMRGEVEVEKHVQTSPLRA